MSTPVLDLKNLPSGEPQEPEENLPPAASEEDGDEGMAFGIPGDATVIAWEAHHPLPEHGRQRHYLLLAALTIAGGAVALWQDSWSTMLVILLGAGAWELHEHLARPVQAQADAHGVTVNGLHYPHASLTSFDLHGMPDGTVELSLMTDLWHSQNVRVPLGDQDPYALRELLLQHIPEGKHEVSRLEWWLRSPRK